MHNIKMAIALGLCNYELEFSSFYILYLCLEYVFFIFIA